MGLALVVVLVGWELRGLYRHPRSWWEPRWNLPKPAPLVMKGGDPYIRALMRTISASESNVPRPYSVIYGGRYINDFNHHPDICVPIEVGPNVGLCTTAAGRYQFITTTWLEVAEKYHPEPSRVFFWNSYSFDPTAQDTVVYRWLDDPGAWGRDLRALLRQGKLLTVLKILSPTWTSLGYGIESNDMTGYLPSVYAQMLKEELKQTL
jgi:muramidase (phage lysozyme)